LSKLPVVSGADCVKALGKVGFVVFRQRGSHITMVRRSPPAQTTIPNHKELEPGHFARNHSAGWCHGRRVYRTPVIPLAL